MSGARPVPRLGAAIRAIALNTFREAIRDRVLYVLFGFAIVLIGISRLVSRLTVGDEEKIIKDIGLSAISIFGLLTAVFVGVSLVFKEIERRTIYTLLANPVRRWQFVAGKFVGLLGVLATNAVLMSAALVGLLLLRGDSPWGLLPAILLILVEMAVVTAFALLFSSVTNPVIAALCTAATYVAGHLSWSLKLLGERLGGGAVETFTVWLYRLLPNLSYLDIKAEAVHGRTLAPGFVGLAVAYGTAYAAIVLALACVAFQRREFR